MHGAIIGNSGPEAVQMNGKTGQPNAVMIDGDNAYVGDEAVAARALNPENYSEHLKCFFGQRDPDGQPFKVLNGLGDKGNIVSLCAHLLAFMVRSASTHIAKPVFAACIAHHDQASQLVKDDLAAAAKLVGIEKPLLIGESQAILVAANHYRPIAPGTIGIIIDNGHLTQNVVVFESISAHELKTLAVATSEECGGSQYTAAIVEILRNEAAKQGIEIDDTNPEHVRGLNEEAKRLKHLLSANTEATAMLAFTGKPFKYVLTRAAAEEAWQHLRKEFTKTINTAIKSAGIKKDKIGESIGSGGTFNIPFLRAEAGKLVGRDCKRLQSPEMMVAFGAALAAPQMFKDHGFVATTASGAKVIPVTTKLRRKTSRHLGVKTVDLQTMKDCLDMLVPIGTSIPHKSSKTYGLTQETLDPENQHVEIVVLQPKSEDEPVNEAPVLATHTAHNLANSHETKARIRLDVEVTADEVTRIKITDTANNSELGEVNVEKPA
jgi:molecular chaperone DnaK (HSP70)